MKTKTNKRILVVSSTYPSSLKDKVPAFVKDQIQNFIKLDKSLEIKVLSPHNQSSISKDFPQISDRLTSEKFHYFFPRFEKLTDKGIMPALSTRRSYYLLIPFLMLGELLALYRHTRKFKPDFIYAHWFTPQAINASLVSRLTNTPFVFTTHASDVAVWKRFGFFGKFIVKTFSKNSKAITAVSSQTFKKFNEFFDDKLEVKIIPMGIHLTNNIIVNKKNHRLLFIGRLTEKKGLQVAIPAFKRILTEYPDAILTIAGDGEKRKELEELCLELKVNKNVNFVGFVSGDEKKELFKNHALMIVPSIVTSSGDSEGLPVSLMEGLSYGHVTISTTVSGSSDIITSGENGFIIPPEDIDALYSQIKECFEMSKQQTTEIRRSAIRKSEELSWPSIAKKHLDYFYSKVGL